MKLNFSLILLFLAFAFFACNTSTEPKNSSAKEEKESDEMREELSGNDGHDLQLNNGSRWIANAATQEGILNMQNAVQAYQQENSADIDSLQMQLFSEFRSLVEKCTMKGEAHDQLHYYIFPLKKKIDSLKQGDAGENVEELEVYLRGYHDYFKEETEVN